jgi:FkbM family methyltransferase
MSRSTINVTINKNRNLFHFRNDSAGDKGVIKQIFVNRDYEIYGWPQGKKVIEYHKKISKNHSSLIVDAGANIGASTVFFANSYKNSLVFAIEPDEKKFHLLSLNNKNLNSFNFKGAISSEDGELIFLDPGHSDWGFRTTKIEDNNISSNKRVPSICPASILNHPAVGSAKPLIFKIDIEGAEDDLFSKNTHWMKDFPLIIIELHDWMLPFSGSSKNFLKAVVQYEFDFVYRGENIFLFNRDMLR